MGFRPKAGRAALEPADPDYPVCLYAGAVDVGLLAGPTPQRAVSIRSRVKMVLVVLERDGTADRALPSVGLAAALRTWDRCRMCHHQPPRTLAASDAPTWSLSR